MIDKYNNPRLHNTVLTGPGMTHPRNPHVVIGSDEQGFIQGDLMDANAIMETIDQKIDVDNLIDEEKLTTTVQSVVNTATEQINNTLETKADKEYVDNIVNNISTDVSWPIITIPYKTRVEKEIPVSIIQSGTNAICNYVAEQRNDYFYNNTENPPSDEVDLVFYITNVAEGNKTMEFRFNSNCFFDDNSSGYVVAADHEYINILTNSLNDGGDTTDPYWSNNISLTLDQRYFLHMSDDQSGVLCDIVAPDRYSDGSDTDTISLEELCTIDQIQMFNNVHDCKVYRKSYNDISNMIGGGVGTIGGKIFWNNIIPDQDTSGQLIFSQIVCDIWYQRPHYNVINEVITTSAA